MHKKLGCGCRVKRASIPALRGCGPVVTELSEPPKEEIVDEEIPKELPFATLLGLYKLPKLRTSSVASGHSHPVQIFVNPPMAPGDGGTVVAVFMPAKNHLHVASIPLSELAGGLITSSIDVGHTHTVAVPESVA